MTKTISEDYRWLISDEAAPILSEARLAIRNRVNALTLIKKLRKKISPERSALVMEQAQLRIRAKKKFPQAETMFFTRRGLEQSSGTLIAQYKAMRFAGLKNVADICCGIGGDLIGLGKRGIKSSVLKLEQGTVEEVDTGSLQTVGVDADALTSLFASHNLEANGLDPASNSVEQVDFEKFDLSSFDGFHIDPDRRKSDRTVHGNRFSPSLSSIFECVSKKCCLAIKVAPATPAAEYFPGQIHREWIGDHRECKQQIIWAGPFASQTGLRTATYIGRNGQVSQISSVEAELEQSPQKFDSIQKFLYEPHAAVLAAGMTDVLARKYNLGRFTSRIVYLTGDRVTDDPLLSRFEVLKILPMGLRQTVKVLNSLDVGQVEVKKRGVDNVTFQRYERLKLSGPNKATLILTRWGDKPIVIIARRDGNDLQVPK